MTKEAVYQVTMTFFFLTFFQIRVLLDELLLAVSGEADRELGLVARAFPAQHQAPAILRMADIGTGKDVVAGSADVPVRIERGARTRGLVSEPGHCRWRSEPGLAPGRIACPVFAT